MTKNLILFLLGALLAGLSTGAFLVLEKQRTAELHAANVSLSGELQPYLKQDNEPLFVDTDALKQEGLNVVMKKTEVAVADLFTVTALEKQAKNCDPSSTKTGDDWGKIMQKWTAPAQSGDAATSTNGRKSFEYTFSGATASPTEAAKDANPSNETYTITLVPNAQAYASLSAFEADFQVCEAGAKRYPARLNDEWLLFVSGCGGAVQTPEEAASTQPVATCQDIRNALSQPGRLEFR